MKTKIISEPNRFKLTEQLLKLLPPFKRMVALEQTLRSFHKHLQGKIQFNHRNDGAAGLRETLRFIQDETFPLIKLYDRPIMENAPTSKQTRSYQRDMNQATNQLSTSLEYYVSIDKAIDAVPSDLWPILKNITIDSFITLSIQSRTMPSTQRISKKDNNNSIIQRTTEHLINLAKIETLHQEWIDTELFSNEFCTFATEDFNRIHNGMLQIGEIFKRIKSDYFDDNILQYGKRAEIKLILSFDNNEPAAYIGGAFNDVIRLNPEKSVEGVEAFLRENHTILN